MRNKPFIISILAALLLISLHVQAQKPDKKGRISDYSDFESAMPPVRYHGNPIIRHGGWAGGQVQEPCILENPKDRSKLVMFYAGANLVAKDGGKGAIAKAWAYKSDPYVWFEYPGNPILTSTGQGRNDGTHVSQSAIIIHKGTYYMYYSYRGTEVLPGIRYATSVDGKTWIKQGTGDILSRGSEGSPDSHYFEWKQVFKAFGKFILMWESFNGKEWTACMASSDSPGGPWTKSPVNPIFRPSGTDGTFDKLFAATPAFYLINNKWYFYYVGACEGGNYNYNTWDMGAAELLGR
ncbi:MAG TPA: hypothetical protein DDW27_16250 [Bacteroidales bacterium]|nr:hypothetical protein [Bacteroidales bacterium]